ncbi:unnamed protein product [Musa acuminata var. zebrina]
MTMNSCCFRFLLHLMDVTRGSTCIMSSYSVRGWVTTWSSTLRCSTSPSTPPLRKSAPPTEPWSRNGTLTNTLLPPAPKLRPSSKPSPKPISRTTEQWLERNHLDTGARSCRDCGERVVQEGRSRMPTGGPRPPSVERKLGWTLEELCRGCKKEVKFTRDIVTNNGLIVCKEETQTIWIKPGWKKGTKITFEGKEQTRKLPCRHSLCNIRKGAPQFQEGRQ